MTEPQREGKVRCNGKMRSTGAGEVFTVAKTKQSVLCDDVIWNRGGLLQDKILDMLIEIPSSEGVFCLSVKVKVSCKTKRNGNIYCLKA